MTTVQSFVQSITDQWKAIQLATYLDGHPNLESIPKVLDILATARVTTPDEPELLKLTLGEVASILNGRDLPERPRSSDTGTA